MQIIKNICFTNKHTNNFFEVTLYLKKKKKDFEGASIWMDMMLLLMRNNISHKQKQILIILRINSL